MRSGISVETYLVLSAQSGILPCSANSAYDIQGQLHPWLTYFVYSREKCVALNGILSSPLPVEDGVPQGSVLGPVLFLIFINDPSDSLENPLYLSADDSTLCLDIPHLSYGQAAPSSLSLDLDKITRRSNTWNMSFNPDKSHTLTISPQKDHPANPPIYFLNNPLEEVQSQNPGSPYQP